MVTQSRVLELPFSIPNPSQAKTGVANLISIGILCLEVPWERVSNMGWCKEIWDVLNKIWTPQKLAWPQGTPDPGVRPKIWPLKDPTFSQELQQENSHHDTTFRAVLPGVMRCSMKWCEWVEVLRDVFMLLEIEESFWQSFRSRLLGLAFQAVMKIP